MNEQVINAKTLNMPLASEAVRKKKIYAIFDRKKMAYLGVLEKYNDKTAIRDFEMLANRNDTLISQSPEDFKLSYLGYMNEETGELVAEFKDVAEAKEYIKEEK